MAINLPYPVSANRYWRKAGHRVYRSPEAVAYCKLVANAALWQGAKRLSGDVGVLIIFQPKATKSGAASKTRLDLDNALKVVLDALNGVLWDDDKQIVDLRIRLGDPVKSGGLQVAVWVP